MKKRLLSVFLALLMLCSLVACSDYGEFYTEDGILQNTKVTLTVETKETQAPVTELTFYLREETDFNMSMWTYGTAEEVLEIFEDGSWKTALTFGGYVREGALGNNVGTTTPKHQQHSETMRFWEPTPNDIEEGEYATFRYLPLTAGKYRLRVRYSLHTEDESVEIPEGQLEAVAYFTVTAPAE